MAGKWPGFLTTSWGFVAALTREKIYFLNFEAHFSIPTSELATANFGSFSYLWLYRNLK
jgi:hypothetical protein